MRSSRLVADRYFELATAAIKAADPNHLVLGCRFAYARRPRPSMLPGGMSTSFRSIATSIDVECRDRCLCRHQQALPDRRVFLSRRRFRPAQHKRRRTASRDQAERAACFQRYVTAALRHPTLVGYHWFEHADQPAEGRFDGENSNFGTVTIEDRVYEELTRAMTAVNAAAEDHAFRGDRRRMTNNGPKRQ